MKNIKALLIARGNCLSTTLFALSLFLSISSFGDYSKDPLAITFRDEMIAKGISKDLIDKVLISAERKDNILESIARPAEKTKKWFEYRKIFLDEVRITDGVLFLNENSLAFDLAEKTFGVPREIIAAIIGVETRYGKYTGGHRVVDALATLAFDYPKRAPFFRSELSNLLYLVQEQDVDPLSLTGSYAGAMGLGQFMPSSYRNYAVDFDTDGKTDIWNNKTDAIGSVANYLAGHGWEREQAIIQKAKWLDESKVDNKEIKSKVYDFSKEFNQLRPPAMTTKEIRSLNLSPDLSAYVYSFTGEDGGEVSLPKVSQPFYFYQESDVDLWLAYQNFYVITRYNHSHLYAMAVYQLSQEILNRYRLADDRETSLGKKSTME